MQNLEEGKSLQDGNYWDQYVKDWGWYFLEIVVYCNVKVIVMMLFASVSNQTNQGRYRYVEEGSDGKSPKGGT